MSRAILGALGVMSFMFMIAYISLSHRIQVSDVLISLGDDPVNAIHVGYKVGIDRSGGKGQ
jgi:hypothetical protein